MAVQGFGNVGAHAALFLEEAGARVVAVSNRHGGVHHPGGVDVSTLFRARLESEGEILLHDAVPGERLETGELLELEVDILVPAALEDAVNPGNVDAIGARLIVEGANAPVDHACGAALEARGVTIVPDILANAGGVTVSYLEWVQNRMRYQWTEERVNRELEGKLRAAWESVRDRAGAEGTTYREAAYDLGVSRVMRAIRLRGF